MSQSFSIFKYCAMIAPILGIIVIIGIICFCVRLKGLGQLMSLISMPKVSSALPIVKSNEDWKEEYDMFASFCTLLLLLLWLVYLFLQYYKFFDRVQKTISLPFKECVSATCCCCYLPTPMTRASGGSPMFPLVVYQPASPSIRPAVQSLRRGLSTNPGVTMWCVCGCS